MAGVDEYGDWLQGTGGCNRLNVLRLALAGSIPSSVHHRTLVSYSVGCDFGAGGESTHQAWSMCFVFFSFLEGGGGGGGGGGGIGFL